LKVLITEEIEGGAVVAFPERVAGFHLSGQQSPLHWTISQNGLPMFQAVRHQLGLNPAFHHAIWYLVGNHVQIFRGLGKLIYIVVTYTRIPDLTLPDKRFYGLHGLLDRRGAVRPMDLIKIDVVGTQTAQAVFTLLNDALPARIFVDIDIPAGIVLAVESKVTLSFIPPHPVLGQDINPVPGDSFDCFTHNLF